jgi:transposase InsO family protein
VHHEGRGSPYASAADRHALERAFAIASMSTKGDGWDNAVAESFFATLKPEALDDRVPDDHDAATRAIGHSIDGDDSTKRSHSFIGFQSPIRFESKTHLAALAAWSSCLPAMAKFTAAAARSAGTDLSRFALRTRA